MTTGPHPDHAAVFAEHRRYLFAVAYRMLGVAEDAEDVLQDAWLRFDAGPAGLTAIYVVRNPDKLRRIRP
jgi:DNA-directed RNA polymerase specialized sigma24 family protein